MDKAERDRLRESASSAIERNWQAYSDAELENFHTVIALLDHIDALEQKAAEAILCWDKIYPDADAKKIGITQDELEDMEFGPINGLRKAIAAAPEPQE